MNELSRQLVWAIGWKIGIIMKNRVEGVEPLENNAGFQQFTIYPSKKGYETMIPPIRRGVESMTRSIRGGLASMTPPPPVGGGLDSMTPTSPPGTFTLRMTLPIELDLDMVQPGLYVKFLVHMSNGSIVRAHTDTHIQTWDRFYHLDHSCGRLKFYFVQCGCTTDIYPCFMAMYYNHQKD